MATYDLIRERYISDCRPPREVRSRLHRTGATLSNWYIVDFCGTAGGYSDATCELKGMRALIDYLDGLPVVEPKTPTARDLKLEGRDVEVSMSRSLSRHVPKTLLLQAEIVSTPSHNCDRDNISELPPGPILAIAASWKSKHNLSK